MEEEMKKKIEEVIVHPLCKYINNKHTQEETIGFIDGFAEGFVDGAKYRDSLANQWISVEDRLPEGDEAVLCSFGGWDDNIFYRVFSWCKIDNEWTDWDGISYKSVTHWMPLPQPPKEK